MLENERLGKPASKGDVMSTSWGYEEHNGPEHWGDLDAAYGLCKLGRRQSPVDIVGPVHDSSIGPLGIGYRQTNVVVLNNGHSIQVNCDPGSTLAYAGKKFELLQFHFHSPSEHLIEGRSYAMEAHFVHRSPLGEFAVIGVIMEPGEENPILASFWQQAPAGGGTKETGTRINPAELLPFDVHFYAYTGSLTTPPCSEGVEWIVMKEPIAVSREQIDHFLALIGENIRPVQPLHGRLIREF